MQISEWLVRNPIPTIIGSCASCIVIAAFLRVVSSSRFAIDLIVLILGLVVAIAGFKTCVRTKTLAGKAAFPVYITATVVLGAYIILALVSGCFFSCLEFNEEEKQNLLGIVTAVFSICAMLFSLVQVVFGASGTNSKGAEKAGEAMTCVIEETFGGEAVDQHIDVKLSYGREGGSRSKKISIRLIND